MGLAVVRNLASPRRLITGQDAEDFEQELVDQFALAVAASGATDSYVSGERAVIFEFRRFLARPVRATNSGDANRYLVHLRKDRAQARHTVENEANTLARTVGVAKQRNRRHMLNPLNWLQYLSVGYGYRTWLAGIWLAGLAVLGWWVFTRAYPHHMSPATPKPPAFHALVYTLDVLLPIVDLGQEKAWTPHGWALYWSWSLIAVGWVLTTAAVAGLTGIFKRD
jgi:hypothetical protein